HLTASSPGHHGSGVRLPFPPPDPGRTSTARSDTPSGSVSAGASGVRGPVPYPKRTAALASAAALAGPAVLLTAPVARADVVDVDYRCRTPIGDKGAVSPIDIKGVRSGGGHRITMSWQKDVSSSPVELGKGAMSPSATIEPGRADRGRLEAHRPAANTPIKISDLSGTYTPAESGEVTFTAGVLTIEALGMTTTCTPTNDPGPSLVLDVTAGGGGGGAQDGGAQHGTGGTGDDGGTLP